MAYYCLFSNSSLFASYFFLYKFLVLYAWAIITTPIIIIAIIVIADCLISGLVFLFTEKMLGI